MHLGITVEGAAPATPEQPEPCRAAGPEVGPAPTAPPPEQPETECVEYAEVEST
jgi:hypothetical protein